MLDDIKKDAGERMAKGMTTAARKTLDSSKKALKCISSGNFNVQEQQRKMSTLTVSQRLPAEQPTPLSVSMKKLTAFNHLNSHKRCNSFLPWVLFSLV